MTLHYDKIIIASATSDLGAPGKTIRQIAEESGRDEEEVILNLLEANDLRVSIFNEVISEFNLELIAKDRFSAVSSDGVGYDFSAKKQMICPTRGRLEHFLAPSINWSKRKELSRWKQ